MRTTRAVSPSPWLRVVRTATPERAAGAARQPRLLHRPRRLAHLRHPLPNHGHHLASVQLLGHRQHLRRRLRRAAPACGHRRRQTRQGRRAYKASYNRPFATRAYRAVNMLTGFVRWLERNGFDAPYWSGRRPLRFSSCLPPERATGRSSVGHDEYWSGAQRAAVTAARDHGMHLAFFSGNEVLAYALGGGRGGQVAPDAGRVQGDSRREEDRSASARVDWDRRDGRTINPLGAMPENEFTGTIYTECLAQRPLTVLAVSLRFWRNTSVARLVAGRAAGARPGHPRHEWDEDVVNGFRPAGLVHLSTRRSTMQE